MKDLAAGAGAVVEGVGVVVAAEVATTAIQRIATDDTGITATMQMSTAEAEDVGVDVGAVEGVGVANGEAEEQAGAEVMSLLMDGLTPMSHVTEATADTAGIHMKTEIKSAHARDPASADRRNRSSSKRDKGPYWQPQMDFATAADQLDTGKLVAGTLRINQRNRTMGFVDIAGLDVNVFIDGDQLRNRALHGDIVVVDIQEPSEWRSRDREHNTARRAIAADLDTAAQDAAEGPPLEDIVAALAVSAGKRVVDATDETDADASDAYKLWRPIVATRGVEAQGADVLTAGAEVEDEVDEAGADGGAAPGRFIAHVDTDLGVLPPSTAAYKANVERVQAVAKRMGLQPTGIVKCIAKPVHKRIAVGLLKPDRNIPEGESVPFSAAFCRIEPFDARIPYVLIPRQDCPHDFLDDPNAFATRMHVAQIVSWPDHSRFPHGVLVESLGMAGDVEASTQAILRQHDIEETGFSDDVLEELKPYETAVDAQGNWIIPEEEIARRRDLRSYRIFTVDPYTAKDLDDALHITPLDDGTFEVGVHIADVSYFVRPRTHLDAAASTSCTSVYLMQRVIPMLPQLLCEQLCSLNPSVDRLAFSCIWKMTMEGDLVPESPWFGRTIIRSCAKLDYGTAQRMIDEDGFTLSDAEAGTISEELWESDRRPTDGHTLLEVMNDVRIMNFIAKGRRSRRYAAGALSLNRSTVAFKRDADGMPTEAMEYPIGDSNRMIEEYMLLANYLVAQQLILYAPKLAVLRHHDVPDGQQLADVAKRLQDLHIPFDISSSGAIQESLQAIGSEGNTALLQGVTSRLMKPMKPAEYFVAGKLPAKRWMHYALAIPYYTHFTSPIRRYADVLVHRLLQATLDGPTAVRQFDRDDAELVQNCDACNDRKMASKHAQEENAKVFFALYVRDHECITDAVVTDVGENSCVMMLPRFGIELQVFYDRLGASGSFVDESDSKHSTIQLTPLEFPRDVPDVDPAEDELYHSRTWPSVFELGMFQTYSVRVVAMENRIPMDIEVVPVEVEGWRRLRPGNRRK